VESHRLDNKLCRIAGSNGARVVNNGGSRHLTTLSEKDLVLVPLASAEPLLRTFFAVHPGPEGTSARLVLRAGNATHPVIAIERVQRPDAMTPCYSIHWDSEGGSPYPAFDGELTVDADEDYNGFWVVLTGAYIPPGGAAGQFFDAAIGNRIARSTARSLLRQMRVEVEALYHAQVQSKASLAMNVQIIETLVNYKR
jgi:hypothetical protein